MITSLLAETKQALEDLIAELKQRKEAEESCDALTRIYGLPVKASYLYFFKLKRLVKM